MCTQVLDDLLDEPDAHAAALLRRHGNQTNLEKLLAYHYERRGLKVRRFAYPALTAARLGTRSSWRQARPPLPAAALVDLPFGVKYPVSWDAWHPRCKAMVLGLCAHATPRR